MDLGTRIEAATADITLAGRQEMLVQRIALMSGELTRSPVPGVETRLARAVDAFDAGHRQLSDAADGVPKLIHIYFESGTLSLTALARRYLDLSRAVLDDPGRVSRATLHEIARLASADLMVQQAEATEAFEGYAADLSSSLLRIQAAAAAMLSLFAAAEGLLVARPLRNALFQRERQVSRDRAEIARLTELLTRSRADAARLTEDLVQVGWTDPLTGLMNRGHFQIRLEAEIEQAAENVPPLGVMAVAVDDFRAVNESLGNPAGDLLLRELAERLRDAAPSGSAVARTDGNGFALAAHFADEASLVTAAKALAAALSRPVAIAGREARVAVRIGTAFRMPSESAERLILNADIALGRTRGPGMAPVLTFAPRMRADLEEREALIEDLRSAIETRDFRAHFQPQIGLAGTGLCGFEVLARWPHPVQGLVPPERFVPLAEDIGLVAAMDGIILENALATLAALREEGLEIPRLSLNTSIRSLLSEGYVGALRDAVAAAGLAPADLAVEIAEARLRLIDRDRACTVMNELRWAGFGVEIDGFGAGLAALSTLSRLPVTGVKLDRALVTALPDPGAESVLRALAGLARELDLRVVAEGVQSSTSLGFLAGIGVQAVQGFGISRPLDADGVREWMGAGKDRTSAA